MGSPRWEQLLVNDSFSPVRLADILVLPLLDGAQLIGPPEARDRIVNDVVCVSPSLALTSAIRPHSLVLLLVDDTQMRWSHMVELLIRHAASQGAAALMIPSTEEGLPKSTTRVAERLGLPLIRFQKTVPGFAAALGLNAVVHAPERRETRVLLEITDAIIRTDSLEDLLAEVATQLGGRVLLADSTRVRVGDAEVGFDYNKLIVHTRTGIVQDLDEQDWALVPAFTAGEHAWLMAQRPLAGARWALLAQRALSLVRGEAVAWLTNARAQSERAARVRSLVLEELSFSGTVSTELVSAATDLGWFFGGWHLGFHVGVVSGPAIELWELEGMAERLSRNGVDVFGQVARGDGWTFWVDYLTPPTPATVRTSTAAVREAVAELRSNVAVRGLVIGVGSPQANADGLAQTLREARDAAKLGATEVDGIAVRAVHDLGSSELLLGWYGSRLFGDAAVQLLGPILGNPDAKTTLETYLENGCSVASTARILSLHRNTVRQRLDSIEQTLDVSLNSPDTRLALQLALRANHSDAVTTQGHERP